MSRAGELVRKHWRIVVFILVLFCSLWFLWLLRSVLLPFVVGFFIAYQLLPLIRWIETHLPGKGRMPQLKRIGIIMVIYIISLAVIGLAVFYVISVMGKSLLSLAQGAPSMLPNGIGMIERWLKSIPAFSTPAIQDQIDAMGLKVTVALGNALTDFLTRSLSLVKSSAGMILGFAIMPVFVFFILKDWDSLSKGVYSALPPWTRTHAKSILSIIHRVTGRYIRGQLLLGLALAVCAGILLFVMKIEFALPLALFAGLTEMVPMVGPWIGGGLSVLVTLSTAPEKTLWVALGFLVISLLENNLLVPKIQGSQMRIHPAFIILLSVIGAYFAGILGFIIILPLTMTILGIVTYFRQNARTTALREREAGSGSGNGNRPKQGARKTSSRPTRESEPAPRS